MNQNDIDETLKKICPRCGKRAAGARKAASLTTYLFAGADCRCNPALSPAEALANEAEPEIEFCARCGLQIVPQSREGSLTGFLFQSTRCKCEPDPDFAAGAMSDRFWKLKQAGGDTIFSRAAESESGEHVSIGLAAGAIIGGEYEIIELLGRGGMGEVYLTRHTRLGRKCALKVIPPEQVTEEGWRRFQQEAKTVANLDHINLVKVTDLGIHDHCLPYYAMDYVEGKNLTELLAERQRLPLRMVLSVFQQVCDGLDCAHRKGILHRDLKPANIIVSTDSSQPGQAKILDFGLAKLTNHDRSRQSLTLAGDIFGSPFYMSPEQCHGYKLDNRSDLYSLGCAMFECLTGHPPFVGNLAASIMFCHMEGEPPTLESVVGAGTLPPSMEIVIAKLLRKNPAERYQTCGELRGDLEKVARGQDVQPIYVSRSRSSPGRQPNDPGRYPGAASDAAERGIEVVPTLPPSRAGFLIAVSVVLLIGGLSTIFFYLHFHFKPSAPALSSSANLLAPVDPFANKQFVSVESSFAKDALIRVGQISCGVSIANGQPVRVFNFPDLSLGTLVPKANQGHQIEARGTVVVPAVWQMILKNNKSWDQNYILLDPSVLTKFGVDDLFGLDVSGPLRSALAPTEDVVSPDLVLAMSKWTGLRELGFSGRKLPDETVKALDSLCAPIEILHVRQTKVNTVRLAKVKWFSGLQVLEAIDASTIDPILFALAGSPRLERLIITGTTPSEAALKTLKTCPNLRFLELGDADLDDRKLDTICDIAGLRELSLKGNPLTATGLIKLRRLKQLKGLDLRFVPVPNAVFEQLRRQMPGCGIQVK